MTSSARDKVYGRRGGRWCDGTAAEAVAELDRWRADKAAAAAADLERSNADQLDLFTNPVDDSP